MTQELHLTVDGVVTELRVPDDETLVTTLRERLQRRDVRSACGVGECGACTVSVDGRLTASCTTPTGAVSGTDVVTPASPDIEPVRRIFLELQAAQCGYCTAGMLVTVGALSDQDEPATFDDLLEALDRHLCRCGAYPRILVAACRALGIEPEPDRDGPGRAAFGTLTVRRVEAVEGTPTGAPEGLPDELATTPRIESWLHVDHDGTVEVISGRSELGQGVHVALRQVVATQLALDVAQVRLRTPSTPDSPDEGFTSGSRSLQQGGRSLAMAATALRRVAVERAAATLGVEPARLVWGPGATITCDGEPVSSLAALARQAPLEGAVGTGDQPTWSGGAIGDTPARPDLEAKLSPAGAFVQDLALPGMLHARAVLPPTYDAELDHLDAAGVTDSPGVRAVIRDGRLVIVVAEDETTVLRVTAALAARARWSGGALELSHDPTATLRALERDPLVARDDPDVDHQLALGRQLRASYSKPYQAHAAMAPSCAVARVDGTHLTVWSQTQGVYPLRAELAVVLDQDPDDIEVIHTYGPGCYGQNGVDDAAAFAAIAARAVPGTPVRFQFSTADEFGWEPYGSAMAADLAASLDDRGCIQAWTHEAVTDGHAARPRGQGDRLAVSWLRGGGTSRPRLGASVGGGRNLEPLYDLPTVRATADHVKGPLRTGSLRSLGAFLHVFAIESFVDELAELAGRDPLEFRLAHLRDPRAREVLAAAAELAGWEPRVGPSGRGRGLAIARYASDKAYVAQVADVDIDLDADRLAVTRVVAACDAGVVVNPEGLRQQVEGGVVHGVSRTFHEVLRADARGVHSRSWSTYPVARFRDTPTIDTVLLDRVGSPPVGVGEAATPPTAPAIANAIDDAIGVRLRHLPITLPRIRDHLLELGPDEVARVRF